MVASSRPMGQMGWILAPKGTVPSVFPYCLPASAQGLLALSSLVAVVTLTLGAKDSPPSVDWLKKMSVFVSAGSLRASFQLRLIEPVAGSTESHWLNWSFRTPGWSSLTRTGVLQLAPRSVERATKISVPFDAVSSIQEQ